MCFYIMLLKFEIELIYFEKKINFISKKKKKIVIFIIMVWFVYFKRDIKYLLMIYVD